MYGEPWWMQSDMDHAEWQNGPDPGDECDGCRDEDAPAEDAPALTPDEVAALLAEMAALLNQ